MGVTIGKVIKAEASTTQNWYLLMSMGREAGHLAFEIGKGIHASMIIIPEMFYTVFITLIVYRIFRYINYHYMNITRKESESIWVLK